ncbi:MAG: response regulator [bacterium]
MDKPLILIIEDEPEMASFIADKIRETGRYETAVAHSAKEGFELLDKHKRLLGLADNQVKCIVLDIKMPEMDGLEFLKEWRQKESFTTLMPVIILTAYEDIDKWTKATAPGMGMAAAYLKKPVNGKELIDTIDKCLFGEEIGNMIEDTRKKKYDKIKELEKTDKKEDASENK